MDAPAMTNGAASAIEASPVAKANELLRRIVPVSDSQPKPGLKPATFRYNREDTWKRTPR